MLKFMKLCQFDNIQCQPTKSVKNKKKLQSCQVAKKPISDFEVEKNKIKQRIVEQVSFLLNSPETKLDIFKRPLKLKEIKPDGVKSSILFNFEWIRELDQKKYSINYVHYVETETNKFTDQYQHFMKKLTQIQNLQEKQKHSNNLAFSEIHRNRCESFLDRSPEQTVICGGEKSESSDKKSFQINFRHQNSEHVQSSRMFEKSITEIPPSDFVSERAFKTWLQIPRCSIQENNYKKDEYNDIRTTQHKDQWGGGEYQITGSKYWQNGSIEEGRFENGQLQGFGREIYPDGSYYIGMWNHGWRHGKGKLVDTNGKKTEGQWFNHTYRGI